MPARTNPFPAGQVTISHTARAEVEGDSGEVAREEGGGGSSRVKLYSPDVFAIVLLFCSQVISFVPSSAPCRDDSIAAATFPNHRDSTKSKSLMRGLRRRSGRQNPRTGCRSCRRVVAHHEKLSGRHHDRPGIAFGMLRVSGRKIVGLREWRTSRFAPRAIRMRILYSLAVAPQIIHRI
jgi:hypothetical protein